MVDKKVSGLDEVNSLADNDVLTAVDVSNQTMSTSGTNVKITKSNLFTGYEPTSLLNTRDTNNRNRANHTGTQPLSSIIIPDNSISDTKLLDYNETFFTPIFKSANNDVAVTYVTQNGLLIKRGKKVLCVFTLFWENLSATGAMYIGGMPASKEYDNKLFRFPFIPSYYHNLNLPEDTHLTGFMNSDSNVITLEYTGNTTYNNPITSTHLSSTGELYGSIEYTIT